MTEEINAGDVSVYLVPDLRNFKRDVEAKTKGMRAVVGVEADTDHLREQIRESTKTTPATVRVTPDMDAFSAKVKTEAAAIAKTAAVELPLTADGERLRREITEQAALIGRLTKAEIPVDLKDATAARAKMAVELDILKQMADAAHPTVEVDADTTAARAQIAALDRDASSARGSVSGLTASILALGPAIVPVTAALVGGGGAFGGAALAGGVGSVGLGASIIGNIKNVVTAQKDLGKARQTVATATTNQANANRAVLSAEQSLTLAQGQSKIATQTLTQARDAERASLRALADQIKGAALAEGDASIAVRQARKNLQDTLKNKNSTDLDRDAARQSYKDALFQLDQVKKRRQEISANAAKERAAGVEGSAQVISARQGVASAEASVAGAQRQVTAARQNQKKATDALKTAQAGLADTQKVLSGPEAAAFVKSLDHAKDAWKDYLEVTSGPAFTVANKGLGLFSSTLPAASELSNIAGDAVGGLLDELKEFTKSDTAAEFFDFFKEFEGPAITQFGHIVGNIAVGIGGLLKAFAPLGLDLGRGLENLTDDFAHFGTHTDENSAFQHFLDYVRDVGPDVARTFGDIVGAAVKIGIWLAPLGGIMLGLVDGIAKFIKDADPDDLDAIAIAIGGIALVFGKGPLGLAFALGATLAHSDKFIAFLKTSGGYAGDLVDAFNDLPDGIKAAAIAAVGVGVIGAKIKGIGGGGNPLTGKKGGILGLFTKANPVPVYVVNKGFGVGGSVDGITGGGKGSSAVRWILEGLGRMGPTTIGADLINSKGKKVLEDIADSSTPSGVDAKKAARNVKTANSLGGFGDFHLPILGGTQIHNAVEDLKKADDKLEDLVKGGKADQAARQFASITREARKQGISIKDVNSEFPHYLAAIKDVSNQVSKIAPGFDPALTRAHSLQNEIKLIGTNARTSRADVKRLLSELDKMRDQQTLSDQGVTTGRASKVDAQLARGGVQEIRGTLSLDRDGVATIRGVAKDAVKAGNRRRENTQRNRAMGSESFRDD